MEKGDKLEAFRKWCLVLVAGVGWLRRQWCGLLYTLPGVGSRGV